MKTNKNDYRFLQWEEIPSFVEERNVLKKDVCKRNPRIKDFYSFFRKQESLFYRERFKSIFRKRCCYCGVSFIRTLNSSDVQIDHIYSKSNKKDNTFNVNDISNLAPTCNVCNYRKSDIVKTKVFAQKISPYTLSNVFVRTNNLSIEISSGFKNDKSIILFYEKLNLGSDFYRLCYFYEYLYEWTMRFRSSLKNTIFFDLFIITVLIGEIIRSNSGYRR